MTATTPAGSNQTNPGRKSNTDVIFIGAGINTLASAVLLAQAGVRVLVLERNKEPGGAVRTLELTLPGFRHELGAANLNPFVSSAFYQKIGPELAAKGVEFISAHHSSGLLLPDGDFLSLTADREANLHAIREFSAADAEAWTAWNADFERCAPYLFSVLGSPSGPAGPLAPAFCHESSVPESVRPLLQTILLCSLREVLTARFESPAVQAMIAAWGLHFDYAPDIAGGCWYPFIETNVIQQAGAKLVKGGAGVLTSALAALVSDLGGEIRLEQAVEAILIEDGTAVGVRLANGETLHASRAVVAGVTPSALLAMAGAHLPARDAKLARNYRYGPGAFIIHLALSDPPNWKARSARDCFYIHNGGSLDQLAAVYQKAVAGELSKEPFFCINQPSPFDSSLAPAGQQVMRLFVRAVPAVIRGDEAGTIRASTWTEEVKAAFADRVLDVIEEHAPDLRERIRAKVIHSPLDLETLNPNLVHGDNNAGSMQFGQFYAGRPFPGMTGHGLPIRRLFMCGAATWPGGGSNPGSGDMVTRQILADRS